MTLLVNATCGTRFSPKVRTMDSRQRRKSSRTRQFSGGNGERRGGRGGRYPPPGELLAPRHPLRGSTEEPSAASVTLKLVGLAWTGSCFECAIMHTKSLLLSYATPVVGYGCGRVGPRATLHTRMKYYLNTRKQYSPQSRRHGRPTGTRFTKGWISKVRLLGAPGSIRALFCWC